ncbi:g7436 [Coccomyxa elongata]
MPAGAACAQHFLPQSSLSHSREPVATGFRTPSAPSVFPLEAARLLQEPCSRSALSTIPDNEARCRGTSHHTPRLRSLPAGAVATGALHQRCRLAAAAHPESCFAEDGAAAKCRQMPRRQAPLEQGCMHRRPRLMWAPKQPELQGCSAEVGQAGLRRTGIAAAVALSSGAVLLRQPVGHACLGADAP